MRLPGEVSACREAERVSLCSAGFKDFPELTPSLDYGIKGVRSLNQMGESHKTVLGVLKVLWL